MPPTGSMNLERTVPHELASMRIESVFYRKNGQGRGRAGTWVLNLIDVNNNPVTKCVPPAEAKLLLTPKIIKWCMQFPDEEFNEVLADRWELFDPVQKSTKTKKDKPPTIERLVVGDGRVHDGMTLIKDRYYASSERFGPVSSFFRINFNSFQVRNLILPRQLSVTVEVERSVAKSGQLRMDLSKYWSTTLKIKMDRFLSDNPGQIFTFGMSGHRGCSSKTKEHRASDKNGPIQVPMSSKNGSCLVAAAVNALAILKGSDTATSFFYNFNMATFRGRMGNISHEISSQRTEAQLRKVKPNGDKLSWIIAQTTGIFLVRMIGKPGSIDHTITIDCKNKLIYDGEELYALELSLQTILACLGDDVSLDHIAEIRELVHQPKTSRGSKHATRASKRTRFSTE